MPGFRVARARAFFSFVIALARLKLSHNERVPVKKLSLIVGILVLSSSLWAQTPEVEGGWRGKLRPYLAQYLGEETAVKILGPAPVIEEVMEMPRLPTVVKSNTDITVYSKDSELRKQGKEFDLLAADKKRTYEVAFLRELFLATRRAPAREDDLAKWLNVLEGGGSREGVYRGLVLDDVYASYESYEEPVSPKLVNWTLAFSRKFLGLGFQADAFKQANLFFLKRHIAEKVLEMLDTMEGTPEDLRRWYAVFSSDIGKEFPNLWVGTIRANTSPSAHLEWAKSAHLQHIKSEVLIKLHTVMNTLQDAQ